MVLYIVLCPAGIVQRYCSWLSRYIENNFSGFDADKLDQVVKVPAGAGEIKKTIEKEEKRRCYIAEAARKEMERCIGVYDCRGGEKGSR